VAGRRSNYKTVGVPTDDTQLTFWTLKQLIQDNGLVPNNLAKRFCKHHIVGIGNTVKSFIRNYKDNNISWYKSGEDSLGNGALMRISPVIVPYLKNPHPSMYADAALATMMTHNSYANTSSCIAFIHILWSLLSMKTSPDSHWWTDTFCSIAETLEGDKLQVSNRAKQDNFKVPLWQFTDKVVNDAIRRNLSVLEACNQWNSGANLYETIPSVLYILARHAQDGDQAIIRAVNDTKDNDSVAAIVGSAIGALYGLNGLPIKWIEDLTGRTRSGDDGAVFKLIFMAKRAFWF
jgi:ADP-ribosylglycohydrolase